LITFIWVNIQRMRKLYVKQSHKWNNISYKSVNILFLLKLLMHKFELNKVTDAMIFLLIVDRGRTGVFLCFYHLSVKRKVKKLFFVIRDLKSHYST